MQMQERQKQIVSKWSEVIDLLEKHSNSNIRLICDIRDSILIIVKIFTWRTHQVKSNTSTQRRMFILRKTDCLVSRLTYHLIVGIYNLFTNFFRNSSNQELTPRLLSVWKKVKENLFYDKLIACANLIYNQSFFHQIHNIWVWIVPYRQFLPILNMKIDEILSCLWLWKYTSKSFS